MRVAPRTLACVPLLLAMAGAAQAQAVSSLRGTVRDADGLPLDGVEIVVRGIERSVQTDAAGEYRFPLVPVGEHLVTARRPGYQASQRTVSVDGAAVAIVDFQLRAIAQQLDSIAIREGRLPPVLTGWVHDPFGRPLENVEILLYGVSRTVRTNEAGGFRFDSLEVKEYQLTARLPGYLAAHSLVPVQYSPPTEVALRLQGFSQDLGTIEVTADRRGIYGVVRNSAFESIAKARVRIHGGGTSQLSDSGGRFAFPDLKPGDYLLSAEFAGLTGRSMNVELPRRGRREVVLTLAPVDPNARVIPGQRWFNHDRGLRLAFSSSVGRMNRSFLAQFAGLRLCDIGQIRNRAGGTEAAIVVDDYRILKPWSLCAFSADEVALISVSRNPTPYCSVQGERVMIPAGLHCVSVWLR